MVSNADLGQLLDTPDIGGRYKEVSAKAQLHALLPRVKILAEREAWRLGSQEWAWPADSSKSSHSGFL